MEGTNRLAWCFLHVYDAVDAGRVIWAATSRRPQGWLREIFGSGGRGDRFAYNEHTIEGGPRPCVSLHLGSTVLVSSQIYCHEQFCFAIATELCHWVLR